MKVRVEIQTDDGVAVDWVEGTITEAGDKPFSMLFGNGHEPTEKGLAVTEISVKVKSRRA